MELDANHRLTKICGLYTDSLPDKDKLYTVACDTRVLKKNEVFKKYCAEFPERIPPDDAGRPVLPILVDYFCGLMWEKLFASAGACEKGAARSTTIAKNSSAKFNAQAHHIFTIFDGDGDGYIDRTEVAAAVKRHLGEKLSSSVVCEQMIAMLDSDGDGKISETELRQAMQKSHHAAALGLS